MYRSSAPHPAGVLVNVDDVSVDAFRVGRVSHFGSTHRCFGAGSNIRSLGPDFFSKLFRVGWKFPGPGWFFEGFWVFFIFGTFLIFFGIFERGGNFLD